MCINLGLSHCDINKNTSLIHTQKAVQNVNLFGVTSGFPTQLPLNSLQMFFKHVKKYPASTWPTTTKLMVGRSSAGASQINWIKDRIGSFNGVGSQRKDVYIKPMNCWICSYKMAKKIGKVQQKPSTPYHNIQEEMSGDCQASSEASYDRKKSSNSPTFNDVTLCWGW